MQDLAWLLFHYAGLEPTKPNSLMDFTLQDITVNMLFSHDLLPQIFCSVLFFIIGKIVFKSNKIGLAGALLVLGHFVLDFFSGMAHHFFGEESHLIGLGLYKTNVYLAIAIEAVFSAAVL